MSTETPIADSLAEQEEDTLTGTNPFEGTMFSDFTSAVLEANRVIAEFNARQAEAQRQANAGAWSSHKVLARAKEIARPGNFGIKDKKPNAKVLTLLEVYEKAQEALNNARGAVVEATCKAEGITLIKETVKPDESELDTLKAHRKTAVGISKQLSDMVTRYMPEGNETRERVTAWLASNPVPAIGSEKVLNVTEASSGIARYRVDVTASRNGKTVVVDGTEFSQIQGFTKASQLASKSGLHKRTEQPSRDDFQKAWESVGNSTEKTVQDTVEFEKDGVIYHLVARPSKS